MASLINSLFLCALSTYVFFHATNSQDPTAESIGDPYRPMTLDYSIRGYYNASICMEFLFNCWEAVRPGYICVSNNYRPGQMHETICDAMRNLCHEVYGHVMFYGDFRFTMYENFCLNDPMSK